MKNRKYWKELLKGFPSLEIVDWLEVLPVYNSKGDAIKCCNPIVQLKREDFIKLDDALRAFEHKFIDSTVWYVDGYHYPKGYMRRAIGFDIKETDHVG